MKLLRHAVVLAALTLSASFAVAETSSSPFGALLSQSARADSNYDIMKQSPLGFWRGMSREEVSRRTTKKADGTRMVQLGEFEFVVKSEQFEPGVGLTALSVEYRNESQEKTRAAFEAYRRALGNVPPDYEHTKGRTEAVPDLDFAMIGWKSPEGNESALALVHSYTAAALTKERLPAGLVSFVVRRR